MEENNDGIRQIQKQYANDLNCMRANRAITPHLHQQMLNRIFLHIIRLDLDFA